MKLIVAAAMVTMGVMGTMSEAQSAAIQYPKARMTGQVDDYFGVKVADPYRWMEEVDSAEVKTWVDAENAVTQEYLRGIPQRAAMKARLMALTNFERYSAPQQHGGRYFYTHNSGLQNQAVEYWQQGLRGEAKVLIDPNTLSTDGTVALNGLSVTHDGRLAAYATAEAGSDWETWHVREIATGKDLSDKVMWSKFGGASWVKDASGFYYSGYDAPKDGAAASMKQVNSFQKIFFHKLGTSQTEDKVVFSRPDDKEIYVSAGVTDDGRWLLLYQSKGEKLQITVRDLANPGAAEIALAPVADARYIVIDNDGETMWLRTTKDAPNGRVMMVDLKHPEMANWKTVIAETKNNLDEVAMVHDTLIAVYQEDAKSMVEMHSRDGKLLRRMELPGIGTVGGFGGKRTDDETFFSFSNFTTPGVVYRVDMKTGKAEIYRQPKLQFDQNAFETKQVFYTSKDGTKIPMFVSYKKGLKLDGNNPTLLYAYGGFNIPLLPAFSSRLLLWMEMGGVYAQANLRGGSEYGEAWHEAGTKLKKQNVFDDFIAAAEWLQANKYTSPKKLAISGASNGGLLVGAVELQRPELFGATLPAVGVMDMLRFDKFTVGFGWKSDYGAPSDVEAEFKAIYKYSPVHNVRAGVKYPPTFITTADHDDRVFPAHSFKFAAAMQAAVSKTAGAGPVLIRIETRAGHGGGMPLSKQVDLTVDQYAFLVKSLGMTGVVQ